VNDQEPTGLDATNAMSKRKSKMAQIGHVVFIEVTFRFAHEVAAR